MASAAEAISVGLNGYPEMKSWMCVHPGSGACRCDPGSMQGHRQGGPSIQRQQQQALRYAETSQQQGSLGTLGRALRRALSLWQEHACPCARCEALTAITFPTVSSKTSFAWRVARNRALNKLPLNRYGCLQPKPSRSEGVSRTGRRRHCQAKAKHTYPKQSTAPWPLHLARGCWFLWLLSRSLGSTFGIWEGVGSDRKQDGHFPVAIPKEGTGRTAVALGFRVEWRVRAGAAPSPHPETPASSRWTQLLRSQRPSCALGSAKQTCTH